MAHDPGHAELHDPETDPLATYVLEPEDVRTLLDRVVTFPGAQTHVSHAPFTGGPIAAVPLSTPDDVAVAARRARAAQRLWAVTALAAGSEPAARDAVVALLEPEVRTTLGL